METITKETIHHLARLCRIDCTDEEIETLEKDVKNILNYIEMLNDLPTEGVTPCLRVIPQLENVFREDKVGQTLSRDLFLQNAPDKVGGLIKVPTVIKKGAL
jgi:aspartyl-tRNA(Asn)/glutamyl-tRNA(Gln) amidotransferase subunit C